MSIKKKQENKTSEDNGFVEKNVRKTETVIVLI